MNLNTAGTTTPMSQPNSHSPLMVETDRKPYEVVRFNALKHGILSRYTVLSHENHADYESLVNSLMDEHLPAGATEQHLIEELASVIWRKRRVLQAEGASINKGLMDSARKNQSNVRTAAPFEIGLSGSDTDLRELMDLSPDDVSKNHRLAREGIEAIQKASTILRKGGDRAFAKALRALDQQSREMWDIAIYDAEYTADAQGLIAFIHGEMTPLCHGQEKESRHHDAIVNQTVGEGLQPYNLESLSRYETHLDRKFERSLAMLLKLKEMRNQRQTRGL